MRTFDDYMRGVVLKYGFGTAEALNDLLEADHALFGIGDDSDYTMLENDVWLKPQIDTVWTDGHSFSSEGATWTLSKGDYGSPDKHVYTFTHTSTGWEGSFKTILRGYWEDYIEIFRCTMEIRVEENDGNHIYHIKGERIEDGYSSLFSTTAEGMCGKSGCFIVKTFINGEPAHSGTISFKDGGVWEYCYH
ncbi:MAG: hypothetical protein IKU36_04615 [Bacteroidales bacterium]|nr:hypothetical protein [Bacteroidales bacterium]